MKPWEYPSRGNTATGIATQPIHFSFQVETFLVSLQPLESYLKLRIPGREESDLFPHRWRIRVGRPKSVPEVIVSERVILRANPWQRFDSSSMILPKRQSQSGLLPVTICSLQQIQCAPD
jgi:hypothetical protein